MSTNDTPQGGPPPTHQQTVIVVGKQKSVGVAFLLAFLFGPLGLLYASVVGGIVMLILGVIIGIFTLGLGLILVWIVCIIWAIVAANSANSQGMAHYRGSHSQSAPLVNQPRPNDGPQMAAPLNQSTGTTQQATYNPPTQAQVVRAPAVTVDVNKSIEQVGNMAGGLLKGTGELLVKLRWAIVVLAVLAIGSYGAWFFFLKPDPVADAEPIAKEHCACAEQYTQKQTGAIEDFFASFSTSQYKTRAGARTAYSQVHQTLDNEYAQCVTAVQAKLSAKQAEHSSDYQYINAIGSSFQGRIAGCVLDGSAKATAEVRLQENIETIIEPRPDIERMKADLIGRTIPNWSFRMMSDFANVSQTTEYSSDSRFESHLAMELNDAEGRTPSANLVLVYNLRDGQWFLDNVLFEEVVYHLTAPSGTWLAWSIPKDASYSFKSGKIFVKADNSWGNIKCGPDVGAQTIPNSNTLRFASREKDSTTWITFTFKPKS